MPKIKKVGYTMPRSHVIQIVSPKKYMVCNAKVTKTILQVL